MQPPCWPFPDIEQIKRLGVVKSWANFEIKVRELASYIFDAKCVPKNIGGVDIDGYISISEDTAALIEITEERNLQKVRTDVSKLVTAKNALFATGIVSRCFCVVNGNVTTSMLDAGKDHHIRVLSGEQFNSIFFDFSKYKSARSISNFGSAVNPLTGSRDEGRYISVNYRGEKDDRDYSIAEISTLLKSGKHIVLLGEYGTGKSRCIREIFFDIAKNSEISYGYPLAINLRDTWGLNRGPEIIRRHLTDLGIDNLQGSTIRALTAECATLLLDGFDELGSQSWSKDTEKLKVIRAKALEGVKDLIGRYNVGVLVSGREHYFNSSEEMFSALGIDQSKALTLRCNKEFTDNQVRDFFQHLGQDIALPDWLPRRPLICQTIAELSEDEIDSMFILGQDEISFWSHFIGVLCQREARIRVTFDAATIEAILTQLARYTRTKSANVGPISMQEVETAFEAVVGQSPVEEAAVMLQRLPGLGRVQPESNDRQFVDVYILDGLRAKDISKVVRADDATSRAVLYSPYSNPLDALGLRILARDINNHEQQYLSFAKKCSAESNKILASDIIAALLLLGHREFDFQGLSIVDGHFILFDMSKSLPKRISIKSSIFGAMVLPSLLPSDVTIDHSIAGHVYGVGAASGLPSWVRNFSADSFDAVRSVAEIRKAGLSAAHEVLVTIIRKTFFQKGSGRKEEALLRGLGQVIDSGTTDKILNMLLNLKILDRFRGDEGWVYTPNRAFASRMDRMLSELRVSKDPLWIEVGDFTSSR